jgi:hypothetical protein
MANSETNAPNHVFAKMVANVTRIPGNARARPDGPADIVRTDAKRYNLSSIHLEQFF